MPKMLPKDRHGSDRTHVPNTYMTQPRDRRRQLVHERLSAIVADAAKPIRAKRTKRNTIVVTEKGWTAPRADNDATHEWAFMESDSSSGNTDVACTTTAKLSRCTGCRCERLSLRAESRYRMADGEVYSSVCPPCQKPPKARPRKPADGVVVTIDYHDTNGIAVPQSRNANKE